MATESETGGRLAGLPLAPAAGAGLGAWLATYLFTYLLAASEIQNSIIGQFTDIPTWKAVGWIVFNAHFVNAVVEIPLVGGTANFVGGEDGFTALLYVLPPVLLLVAGLAVGRAGGVEGGSTESAALAGAAVAVGYGAASAVGVLVFPTENVSVDPVTGVLLAGVVYPLVFGAIGAVAAHATG
ncbi:transporter [Halobaculum sp. MBLA0147]|uniref:transporter n=1 Tax=Halobaculum sp. MBLA0147 TaxID=3079934 RepID=UPI0035238186